MAYTSKELDDLGAQGKAFKHPDGHWAFPVVNQSDLLAAIKAVGMTTAPHNDVRRYLMRRAKALNLSHLIPPSWNADGSLKDGHDRSKRKRWSVEEKRLSARGVEQRASYKRSQESRVFTTRLAPSTLPTARGVATVAGAADDVVLTGQPTVYNQSYSVQDSYGEFSETVAPGALTACLRTCDARLLANHAGLPLARVSAGTLVLTDTAAALTMTARMDGRIDLANAVALAVQRGDLREMSIGFKVGSDTWNSDYTERTIHTIDELYDVSVVSFPASPTTSVELLESDLKEGVNHVDAGVDGTQNQGNNVGVPDNMDGSGTRSRNIAVDLALAHLRQPIGAKAPQRTSRPRRRVDIDATLAKLREPV
jgi:HK97 family phage prohead protease